MIRRATGPHSKHSERGVTMILVALAMMSMLAMVALAIDVITLYSARSETQRVADSAALAAAKVLVDSGQLTDPATYQTGAQALATQLAKDISSQLTIAARLVQAGDVTVTFGSGVGGFGVNPTVTVTVQNAFLPAFFSRIFSRANLTVSATATAEAFTPTGAGGGIPVVSRCVKPLMIPNCDPLHAGAACGSGTTFFDAATGAITNPGVTPAGVIGEQFEMFSNCGPGPGCTAGTPTVGPGPGGLTLYYYPVQLPSATGELCPRCFAGTTNFEQDTACCNPTPISCGTSATLPAVNQLPVDTTVNPEAGSTPIQSGLECLIHQRPGNAQDSLDAGPPLTYPLQIQPGGNHPLVIAGALTTTDLITTSDSLVTLPVYDQTANGGLPPTTVNVIGFLQVFVQQVFPGGGGPKLGEFRVTVVNVLGCGNSAGGAPVSSAAAVPIRLIHQ
jgi:Flp pilus assembly protein TadG